MKTLYLMRHAKSDWSEGKTKDHSRGLTARGKKAARRMGHYMKAERLVPDLVLSSTAKRARLTAEGVVEALGEDIPARYDRVLYFTSPDLILDEIREVGDNVETLLVIGHNPDTQAVAVHLAADAHDPNVEAMARKFPTAALAIYSLDVTSWRNVGWGIGLVLGYLRPKALPEDD